MASSLAERTRIAHEILTADTQLQRLKLEETRDNQTL